MTAPASAPAAPVSAPGALAPRVLFQLHCWLGLILGAFLSFMGLSGAVMSFEDEIMLALSPQASVTAPATAAPLALDELIDRVTRQRPGATLLSLQIEHAPDRAWTAAFLRKAGGRNQRILIDPYNGQLRGEATGAAFFETVRNLHRYLTPGAAKDGIGHALTGASALGLVFFALSGLYLRFSQGTRALRHWLRPDLRLRGKDLYRMLHRVLGTWLVVVYLALAGSGLWWSYDSYRQGLTWLLADAPRGGQGPGEAKNIAAAPVAPPVDWDAAWRLARLRHGGAFQSAVIFFPPPAKNIRIRIVPRQAAHDRAADEITLNGHGLTVVRFTPYAALRPGDRIINNMDPIHTGMAFGLAGRIVFALASAGVPVFFITGLLLYRRRTSAKKAAL
ncbi:PepSY-associated TM helix domain-containing protein [Acerihabitans sp.]|uniref:PepSY-associated TM helix domain-containing protein n=1 Tax=Acerihabitans sp. TaxID=2811394 RepID=UPI002ED7E5DB